MALEPRSAMVVDTVAILAARPGPATANNYRIVLDLDAAVFQWVPDDTTTADSVNVVTHTGGYAGRWHRKRSASKGANLTDAAPTITVAQKQWRVLPAATLSANRILTLDDADAVAGDTITITRLDVEAYTYAIANHDAATLCTLPVSERWFIVCEFDGTDWQLRSGGQLPS